MSLPRYAEYKDSGVEWLGQIPKHWGTLQSRRMFAVRSEPALPTDRMLTASQKHGVLFQADFMELEGRRVVEVIMGTESLKHVEPDDFIISMRSFQGGIEWCKLRGSTSFHYVMLRPVKDVWPPYFAHLFKSSIYIQALRRTTDLIRDGQELRFSNFAQVDLPVVPLAEQKAIAVFLDRETGKIDALIAEQEKLIALLAEKRQATISHAVTKGLDPNARMKDSGVAWLGSVPAHWEVKPLRYCIDYQEGPGILTEDFRDEGVPLLRVAGVQRQWATLEGCNYLDPEKVSKKWKHFRLRKGDLLISASASMGTICEVGEEAEGAIPYTGIIRMCGRVGEMTKSFVRHVVVSRPFLTQIDLLKAGATIQHYGPTHLGQMFAVRPPIAEQHAIAEFIDQELGKLDQLSDEAERAIALLNERRSALIAAAVTGQIDVRGAVTGSAVIREELAA